jgi:hypothetical protein
MAVSSMSLLGAMSSAAGAVTWTNTGDTAFTATAGPGTFSVTTTSLSCTGADASGTTGTAPFTGAIWSAMSGTATFTGCRLAGITTTMDCPYVLTASSFSAGVTSGNLDVTCDVYQGGFNICHGVGPVPGSHTNPSGGAKGFLKWLAGAIVMHWLNGRLGTCPLSPGENSSETGFTFNITAATGGASAPHDGPVIGTD